MIVSHCHGLAFVHIPKCTGTAMRAPLEALQEEPEFSRPGAHEHPSLGAVDRAHVPLVGLRDGWPELFARLASYRLYAALRDPVERFASAMAQHAQMYRPHPVEFLDDAGLRGLLDDMTGELAGLRGQVLPARLVHFQPQADYVELDGQQLVGQLYGVDQAAALLRDIAGHTGGELDGVRLPRGNRGDRPRFAGAGALYAAARRVPGFGGLAARLLTRPRQARLLPLLQERRHIAFLREYYARDTAMLASLDD